MATAPAFQYSTARSSRPPSRPPSSPGSTSRMAWRWTASATSSSPTPATTSDGGAAQRHHHHRRLRVQRPAGRGGGRLGDVFVADARNDRVKEVMPNGTINTVGSGFSIPTGVAVDAPATSSSPTPATTRSRRSARRHHQDHRLRVQRPDRRGGGQRGRRLRRRLRQQRGEGGLAQRHHRRPSAPGSPTRPAWRWTRPATSSSPTRATTRSRRCWPTAPSDPRLRVQRAQSGSRWTPRRRLRRRLGQQPGGRAGADDDRRLALVRCRPTAQAASAG